jgi:Cu/Ag efflux pump CusA
MQALSRQPQVATVAQQVGRAELGEDTEGVEYSELEVNLHGSAAEEIEEVQRHLRRTVDDFPGYRFQVLPFLRERIEETLSGATAPVVVKVFGDDLAALDRAAKVIADRLEKVPGATNVHAQSQVGAPELRVRVRQEDAARFGLRNAHVLDALHALCQGAEVGQVYQKNRVIDLVVVLPPEARADPGEVAGMWLSVPAGRIMLSQVADVALSDGRFLIAHEGAMRVQQVTCGVSGRDLESFVADAEEGLRGLSLPEGVTYELAGEHVARRAAVRELLLLGLAVGTAILLLLALALGSLRRLVLVLVDLPFALVGGVAAVYLTGGILDVGSLIGFVTLFGITTRNSIMMVSHWQHLHEVEGVPWGPELVFRGARERLAPVLMTALVTALGLLPLALGSGEAGREIEGPMALVILGGLASSTVLNLIVLPLLYRRFGLPSVTLAA